MAIYIPVCKIVFALPLTKIPFLFNIYCTVSMHIVAARYCACAHVHIHITQACTHSHTHTHIHLILIILPCPYGLHACSLMWEVAWLSVDGKAPSTLKPVLTLLALHCSMLYVHSLKEFVFLKFPSLLKCPWRTKQNICYGTADFLSSGWSHLLTASLNHRWHQEH